MRRPVGRRLLLAGAVLTAALTAGLPAAGAATVAVQTTRPVHRAYRDGQDITVAVGPNKIFQKYLRVNVLECADPGGKKKNLPTSVDACDGNTIQGPTVIINPNGSFKLQGYTVYSLPNSALGEESTWLPKCDATHYCVLYVGENQEKFSAPKVFSKPFLVLPARTSPS